MNKHNRSRPLINLKDRYGRSYRVVSEDGNKRNSDPWLWQLLCKKGHLYTHGGDRLGAATDSSHSVLVRRLLAVSSARLEQLGEDGANVSFDVADFKAVAAIMRPKRRRQLSPEHRAKLVEVGKRNLRGFAQSNGHKTSARQADAGWATKSIASSIGQSATRLRTTNGGTEKQ